MITTLSEAFTLSDFPYIAFGETELTFSAFVANLCDWVDSQEDDTLGKRIAKKLKSDKKTQWHCYGMWFADSNFTHAFSRHEPDFRAKLSHVCCFLSGDSDESELARRAAADFLAMSYQEYLSGYCPELLTEDTLDSEFLEIEERGDC